MTTETDLWAVALWIEENQRDQGDRYIARQLDRFAREDDDQAVTIWRRVADRYRALSDRRTLC